MLHDLNDSGDLLSDSKDLAVPLHDPFLPLHLSEVCNCNGPHLLLASHSALGDSIASLR